VIVRVRSRLDVRRQTWWHDPVERLLEVRNGGRRAKELGARERNGGAAVRRNGGARGDCDGGARGGCDGTRLWRRVAAVTHGCGGARLQRRSAMAVLETWRGGG
jgi:hypothetical protein